jgi:hypothetical protein
MNTPGTDAVANEHHSGTWLMAPETTPGSNCCHRPTAQTTNQHSDERVPARSQQGPFQSARQPPLRVTLVWVDAAAARFEYWMPDVRMEMSPRSSMYLTTVVRGHIPPKSKGQQKNPEPTNSTVLQQLFLMRQGSYYRHRGRPDLLKHQSNSCPQAPTLGQTFPNMTLVGHSWQRPATVHSTCGATSAALCRTRATCCRPLEAAT